jgi:hypothetical protein
MSEKPAHELSVLRTFILVAIMIGAFVGLIRVVHWVWTW